MKFVFRHESRNITVCGGLASLLQCLDFLCVRTCAVQQSSSWRARVYVEQCLTSLSSLDVASLSTSVEHG